MKKYMSQCQSNAGGAWHRGRATIPTWRNSVVILHHRRGEKRAHGEDSNSSPPVCRASRSLLSYIHHTLYPHESTPATVFDRRVVVEGQYGDAPAIRLAVRG